MKALVTGASGFIGSTLVEELNREGIEVHALMRKTSSPGNLKGMKYHKVEGDLRDLDSLRKAVADVDLVFHLAGVISGNTADYYYEHNGGGTARLAQAAAEARPGLKRFVYVSSLAAGGPVQSMEPRTEDDEDAPVSVYGKSKLQGEEELLKYKDTFPVAIIRPPIVYGPKDKGVFTIIKSVAQRMMLIPRGATETGHKYYSAVHGNDLCQAVIQAALAETSKVPSGEKFYVSGEGVVTYEEILQTIAICLKRKCIRVRVPKLALTGVAAAGTLMGKLTGRTYPMNLDKLNEVVADYWICSNQKSRRLLGFSPKYDLNTGMAHAIEWYKQEKWI